MLSLPHEHNYVARDMTLKKNERKTFLVVVLTAIMMVIEIIAGYLTGSMALLADGWHMASHASALSISLITYRLAKARRLQESFSFGTGKFIPLGGYTSAIVLALIALLMIYESISRFIFPVAIHFNEAIAVALVGLVVNLASVAILHSRKFCRPKKGTPKRHYHDHSLRAAYLHVLADALTSLLAIFALTIGKIFNVVWVDSLMGIVASLVILKWAYGLCKEAGWELLDGHARFIDRDEVRGLIEDDRTRILDLHIWRIAPKAHACEVVVQCKEKKGPAFYREKLAANLDLQHIVVEEV